MASMNRILQIAIPEGKKETQITGCLILKDSNLLFVDTNNKRILLLDKKGYYLRHVLQPEFAEVPYDVCYVKDNTIAVTLCHAKQIMLIDLDSNTAIDHIFLSGKVYAIDSYEEDLFYRLVEQQVVVCQDLSRTEKSRVQVPGEAMTHVAIHRKNIYSTSWKTKKVSCHNERGVLQWEKAHVGMFEPYSIAVDKNGYVYVACKANSNIIRFSSDGTDGRVVLNRNNGIESPYAIYIDRSSSKLLVCNYSNRQAYIFET